MSRSNVIGLDLSLSATGVCAPFAGCDPEPTTIRTSAKDSLGRRMACIASALELNFVHLIGDGAVELAVVEDLPTHAYGAGKTGTVHGVVHLLLFQHAIPVLTVPPATLKKFAVDRGNASKAEMLIAAVKHLGYDGHDDNEADAMWLWALGCQVVGDPVVDVTKYRTTTLGKLGVA